MKLNPDCMRDVLLIMEKMPIDDKMEYGELCNILNGYCKDDVRYSCVKLKEAGFIEANIATIGGVKSVSYLNDITYEGHQFLADIHSDTVWNHVKEVGKKVGSNSASALAQIATGVITALIKQQFLGI